MEALELILRPIGYVRHDYDDEYVRKSPCGVDGVIEILPEYAEGLRELDGFSHIIVVAYLHKVDERGRRVLKIRHRGLANIGIKIDDIPEVGVFASDSPHRPNPIALSIVRLVSIDMNKLYVSGLDLFSGTPVLDIKPYDAGRSVKGYSVPWWSKVLEERVREKFGDLCLPRGL